MKLSTVTRNFLDMPYELITCVDFIRQIRLALGLSFPTNEEILAVDFNRDGYHVDNHLEAYQEDPIKMQQVMLELFGAFFYEVKQPLIGDVLMLKKEEDIWPAVYVGNELAMTSFVDVGVKAIRYKLFAKTHKIFRL